MPRDLRPTHTAARAARAYYAPAGPVQSLPRPVRRVGACQRHPFVSGELATRPFVSASHLRRIVVQRGDHAPPGLVRVGPARPRGSVVTSVVLLLHLGNQTLQLFDAGQLRRPHLDSAFASSDPRLEPPRQRCNLLRQGHPRVRWRARWPMPLAIAATQPMRRRRSAPPRADRDRDAPPTPPLGDARLSDSCSCLASSAAR